MPNGQEITDSLSLNLYTYCWNNPVMYYDPDGHKPTTRRLMSQGVRDAEWASYELTTEIAREMLTIDMKTERVFTVIDGQLVETEQEVPDLSSLAPVGKLKKAGKAVKVATVATANNATKAATTSAAKLNTISQSTLQKKFKHAADFGVKGNWSKNNGELFNQAVIKHVDSVKNPISGTYRGTQKVTHYYDSKTGLNVMVDSSGNFISGWKLSPKQIKHLLENGNVQ
jgi:hypothetical protein